MVDCDASTHAAWMTKHFPGHFFRTSAGQRKGEFANTASGERLSSEGEFDVSGECDVITMGLNFTMMKVDIPVASARRFVASGDDVPFYEGGCCIRHRQSGATVKLLEMGGVYFLELNVKRPVGAKTKTDVVRPAP